MKKIFYAFAGLLLLASSRAGAQAVANSNFETWATRNGVEAPTGWLTTDDVYGYYYNAAAGYYNLGAVTKSTDAHGGSYAAKLTSTSLSTTSGTAVVVPGSVVLGTKTGVYYYYLFPIGGAAYTARPTQMQFYYKNSGAATDSAFALVYLSTTVNSAPVNIGVGVQLLAPAATYTAATIPISYDPAATNNPDSLHIVFASGYGRTLFNPNTGPAFPSNIKANSTLLVDDVVLSGAPLAARADASTQNLLTVAPNPSPGGRFVISSPDKPELAAAPLQVLDNLGRLVVVQPAQAVPSGHRELDLSSLSTGIYLLRLDAKQGVIVRQLTVK